MNELLPGSALVFTFQRDVRLFARRREVVRRVEKERLSVELAPEQLFHPGGPCDGSVRLGNLRVSEFLADGSEVTRAVLQAGAVFRVRLAAEAAPGSGYDLDRLVLMALGETELWIVPPGRLVEAGL
ncbi:MAG: hypothetical protein R6X25_13865 [Candidatus Krumholzibacteriia bacterium]